jgi:hypothetical protein
LKSVSNNKANSQQQHYNNNNNKIGNFLKNPIKKKEKYPIYCVFF